MTKDFQGCGLITRERLERHVSPARVVDRGVVDDIFTETADVVVEASRQIV